VNETKSLLESNRAKLKQILEAAKITEFEIEQVIKENKAMMTSPSFFLFLEYVKMTSSIDSLIRSYFIIHLFVTL